MYITRKPRLWGDVAIFIWSAYFIVVVVYDEGGNLLLFGWRSITILVLIGAIATMLVSARSILKYRSRKRHYETYKEDVKEHFAIKEQLIARINRHFASLDVYPSSRYELLIPDQARVHVAKGRRIYQCMVVSPDGAVYDPETMRDNSIEAVRIYTIPFLSKDCAVSIEYDAAIVIEPDDENDEPIIHWFIGEDGDSVDHEAISTASIAELEELLDLLMQTQ